MNLYSYGPGSPRCKQINAYKLLLNVIDYLLFLLLKMKMSPIYVLIQYLFHPQLAKKKKSNHLVQHLDYLNNTVCFSMTNTSMI